MGKFDGVLLVSDFDNTLIYTENAIRFGAPVPPLPERNREALEYFMARGGRFTIATGRALAGFIRHAGGVPMNAPGVVCNGAAIYDFAKGGYLETAMLDAAARERGQAVLDRFPGVAAEAYHIDNVIHTVHINDITRRQEHVTKAAFAEAASLLDVPLPKALPRPTAPPPSVPAERRWWPTPGRVPWRRSSESWTGGIKIYANSKYFLKRVT